MEFLRTRDRKIVNEEGKEILLQGYGIGNWMNQEGFLFGSVQFNVDLFDFKRANGMDRGRSIDQIIKELCGAEYAEKFWKSWYQNYFNEEDIRDLADTGFNSVRLPLAAKVFLKEEPGITYKEEAFILLDQIINWCEENNLYVVLDMHAAAAGQSGLLCDDGTDNMPHLFTDDESYERTLLLWEKIAGRYCDRAVIAGYDLLNEPLAIPKWDKYLPRLQEFYDEAIRRIRRIDTRHMFFLEGHRFSSRADILKKELDPEYHNWVFAPHLYETVPDLALIGPLLQVSEELNVPLWMGETGGNKEWMTTLYEMLYENHMGVNIWCHKSEENADTAALYTFPVPDHWEEVLGYAHKGEKKPSYERAIRIFENLLENIKFKNCTPHKDRACAILRKPGVKVPAIGYNMLPGIGYSFQGTYPYCIFCGYRREDRMHLVYEENYTPCESPNFSFCANERPAKYGDWMHINLKLHEDDFACYQIRKIEEKTKISIECYSNQNAKLEITCNEMRAELLVPAGKQMLLLSTGIVIKCADTFVKVKSIEGEVILHSIIFE